MRSIREKQKVFFIEDILTGFHFIYDNDFFIKTDIEDSDGNIIAIHIESGCSAHFEPNTEVELIEQE